MLLGIDVGGTFTDAVLAVEGQLYTAKAPSTPQDQSEGVLAAVDAALEKAQARAEQIEWFAHGMTVATNALLEGNGARTALIATEGFTDVVALGRQARAQLYRLCAAHPAPLTPPELRFGAPERMGPDGPLRALDDHGAGWLASQARDANVEAVAVVLLHAYRHGEHEQIIGDALRQEMPDVHVSLSHQVVGTFREYERAATTEIDAALSPLLGGYLRRLTHRCEERQIPEPVIMSSAGGLIETDQAAGHAALTVLSGPAAGAAGAAFVARSAGIEDAVCLDMGGTSCDVCVVQEGSVQERPGGEIADRPVALPMLAVHTVGAGGGSIGWRDPGGALRVGPRSAGADPGPACYGRGGEEPTVTDANLLLGRLASDSPLAGGVELDREAAERAVGELAQRLSLSLEDCAAGIITVANAEMVRALRVVTVQRGIDPREHALLAFGGAGPLHACAIADELGMRRVLCPRSSGVLAALGLVVSPQRHDFQRSVFLAGEELTTEAVARATDELAERGREALHHHDDVRLEASYELRYRGQSFELAVGAPLAPDPKELRERFEGTHESRYGYRDPDGDVELVTVRVTATLPAQELSLGDSSGGESPERSRRQVILGGVRCEVEVTHGAPPPGTSVDGPAIVELAESTLLVGREWSGEVDDTGSILLERTVQS